MAVEGYLGIQMIPRQRRQVPPEDNMSRKRVLSPKLSRFPRLKAAVPAGNHMWVSYLLIQVFSLLYPMLEKTLDQW